MLLPSSPGRARLSTAAAAPRRRRRMSGWAGRLVHLALGLLVVAAVGLVLINMLGVPPALTVRILDALRAQGLDLEVRKFRIDLLDGLVGDDVRLFSRRDPDGPEILVKKIAIDLEPRAWLRGEPGVRGLWIKGGAFKHAASDEWRAGKMREFYLKDVAMHFVFEPGGTRMDWLRASIMGISLTGSGYVVSTPGRPPLSPIAAWQAFCRQVHAGATAWLTALAGQLNAIAFDGPREINVLYHINPADLARESYVKIELRIRQARWRGVTLGNLQAVCLLEKNQATIPEISCQIGAGDAAGPLRAAGVCRLADQTFEITAHTDFEPLALLPVLTTNQANVVRDFHFKSDPPHGDFSITGRLQDPAGVRVAGTIKAGLFTFRGVPVTSLETGVLATNNNTLLKPMLVERPEGELRGDLRFDFPAATLDFHAESTVDPLALGRIIGPGATRAFQTLRYGGPVNIQARGRVDYARLRHMDFQADVAAIRLGLGPFEADRCRLVFGGRADHFFVRRIEADMYGGRLDGDMVLYPTRGTRDFSYAITARVERLGFRDVAQHGMPAVNADLYSGSLDGRFVFVGVANDAWKKHLAGSGDVVITEGQLLQVPLLGPISSILNNIYPSLGNLVQTEFRSRLALRNQVLTFRNAKLLGNIISIDADGDYTFGGGLDFDVQVKLLRDDSLLVEVVNLLTYPLTKMFLNFHLGGTLQDPDWRPMNLPKEMYLDFD